MYMNMCLLIALWTHLLETIKIHLLIQKLVSSALSNSKILEHDYE
jgi:hypothetical protein